MFKLSILLLTVTLAYSFALSHPSPIIKKQAIYPNSIPQNFAQAAPQNVQGTDPNSHFQHVQEPSIRSTIPQQPFLAQQQQQLQPQQQLPQQQFPQQQFPQQQQQLVQPTLYAAAQQQPQLLQQQQQQQQQPTVQPAIYAGAQQQAQQYPYGRQFQYFPQQQFYQPQQPIFQGANGPASGFYNIPNQYGFDQQSGNGGWNGGSGWYPPSFGFPNFPSFPAQLPSGFPAQLPSGFPDNTNFPSNPFYPSNGAGNSPAGGSTNGPDSVVTVAPNADGPGASDGNSIVLVGGSRPKPEKIDSVRQNVPQQQYVFVPQQQQIYGQVVNGQNDREIAQLNSAAKGAISSYLIYKDAAQKGPQQQHIQQLVPQQAFTQQSLNQQFPLPQQVSSQQVVPQQVLIPQQVAPQQVAPQQVLQQQALPNSLIGQQFNAQLNAQQLDAQQLNAQQLDAQQLAGQQFLQQQLVQQQQQQQQQYLQQPQQQLISQPQLLPQQQLVQQQNAPQQQQFVNQFVPAEQKPNEVANSQESASLAYQRYLLQSKQKSEEPSLKLGFKPEENFPGSESPAVTSNSLDAADITRSSGSSLDTFQNFGARLKAPTHYASQQYSRAEAAPNAVAYAGIGGVAGASPVGTAVTGKGGKASSAPRGIAIAGTSNEAPEFNVVPARSAPSQRHLASIAKYSPDKGYHIAKTAHLNQLQQLQEVQQGPHARQVQLPVPEQEQAQHVVPQYHRRQPERHLHQQESNRELLERINA